MKNYCRGKRRLPSPQNVRHPNQKAVNTEMDALVGIFGTIGSRLLFRDIILT